MAEQRIASAAQLHRLSLLGCLVLVDPGDGEPIPFETANERLAETARQGLWRPNRPAEPTTGAD